MIRRLLPILAALAAGVAIAAAGGGTSVATAQPPPTTTTTTTTPTPGPPYVATPPTNQVLYRDGQTGRYLLGGEWLYEADPSDQGVDAGWYRNVASTTGWTPVTVPNAFNAGVFTSAGMYGWVGWYRRDFTLPTGAFGNWVPKRSQDWIVRFESVNYHATVWLNGHELGSHDVAFLPFEFDLKPYLRAGVNRLIVRVDNRRSGADFPPGPGGIWWNFGGLLREVYLRAAARADLQSVQVRPILPCPTCASTIEDQALVRNVTNRPQTVQLTGTYGNQKLTFGEDTIPPGGTWSATAAATIAHPKLWSIGVPNLYKATLTLSDVKGKRLGGYVTYSGIRSIAVNPQGQLLLNGRALHIRGVNMHEQNISDGAAMTPAQLQRMFGYVKQLGATMLRAHYPLNPQLEEMADRAGVLLWSEVPVYQTQLQYMSQPGWLAQAQALVQDNILTNQNHPSIALWSIGNELPQTVAPPEAHYIATAAALARQLDPTRPVGMAIKDWPGLGCQAEQYAPLDVVGVNEYFGWFDVGGGVTDDRDSLGPFLDTVHQCMPNKAVIITEFGVDGNRDGSAEERGTYEFQANTAAYDLGVFDPRPWLSGALYFLIQDYAAYPSYSGGNPLANSPFNQKGLFDLYGNPKPVFPIVQAIYAHTKQIAPDRRSHQPHRARGL
jgi:beta-glucuronidase